MTRLFLRSCLSEGTPPTTQQADHLGLDGTGCFGGEFDLGFANLFIVVIFGVNVALLFYRNPQRYWFRKHQHDPYDLTTAYDDFALRAEIGRELAAADTGRRGFVDPAEKADLLLYGGSGDDGAAATDVVGHTGATTARSQSQVQPASSEATAVCAEIAEIEDHDSRALLQRAMLDFEVRG